MSINAANPTAPVLAEQDPGYGKIFAVLSRRRFWLLGGLSLGLVIAISLSIISKPKYTSSMRLLVESTYKADEKAAGNSLNIDSNIPAIPNSKFDGSETLTPREVYNS